MCSWITERREVDGFARGIEQWTSVNRLSVYDDHPNPMPLDHALIIDFSSGSGGIEERVRIELTGASARALVDSTEEALDSGRDLHEIDQPNRTT